MFFSNSVLLLCSFFYHASCSPSPPATTPPAVLRRTLDNDPAFRGYTSTNGSYSPLYCIGDGTTFYSYATFGNIADCCPVDGGICHPATDCGTDYEGSTRAIEYQGGDTLTCLETNCNLQLVFNTQGDPRPKSVYHCGAAGSVYLTTPGSPASSTSGGAAPSNTAQSSQPTSTSAVPAKKATSHVGLIAGGVAIGVLLVLAIAGLSIYICMLQRKNKDPKTTPNTELQKMQAAGKTDTPTGGFKAELPTNEGWAVELPPESAPPSRHGEQKPWSGLNGGGMPNSPAPVYSPAPPYSGGPPPATSPFADGANAYYGGPNAGMAELPGARPHRELPGSERPHYAELG